MHAETQSTALTCALVKFDDGDTHVLDFKRRVFATTDWAGKYVLARPDIGPTIQDDGFYPEGRTYEMNPSLKTFKLPQNQSNLMFLLWSIQESVSGVHLPANRRRTMQQGDGLCRQDRVFDVIFLFNLSQHIFCPLADCVPFRSDIHEPSSSSRLGLSPSALLKSDY